MWGKNAGRVPTGAKLGIGIAAAVLIGTLSGCAGASRVRSLPPDRGAEARYWATVEEAAAVIPSALSAVGHKVVETSGPDSTGASLIGLSGVWLGSGEASRVRVEPMSNGTVAVRTVAKARYVLDPWPRSKTEFRILGSVDREFGPGRVAPFPGLRVRGVRGGEPGTVKGILQLGEDEAYSLTRGRGEAPIPLSELTDLSAVRGTYGYGRIGAVVGVVVGLLVTVGGSSCDMFLVIPYNCEAGGGSGAALVVGPAVGFALGSIIRVEIRSPLVVEDPRRIGARQ